MTNPRSLLLLAALTGAATLAAVSGTRAPAPDRVSPTPFFDEGVTCVSNEIMSTIFAEGTDPAIIAKVYNMILKPLEEQNQRYFTGSRWPVGSTGTPVAIAYSFPNDGLSVDGGTNVLHADLTGIFGTEAAWKDLFRQVFDKWEEFSGNIYTEVSDNNSAWGSSGPIHGGSGRGDIRIASIGIDGSGSVLAYNYFPGGGVGGDMVLDSADNWGSGAIQNYRFFRNVIAHENGHGMGLHHVCTDSGHRALMNPFASTLFDGPQHDDIRGMQRLYGDYNEPNNNTGAATDLGLFSGFDSATFLGLSVSGSEDDFFSLTFSTTSTLTVTVTPTGQTYNMGQQAGDGSCPTGPLFDSVDQHDFRIRVLNSVGTEIAIANDTIEGLPETLSDVSLPGGTQFYVVVDSLDTLNSQTQLYNVTISSTLEVPLGDTNGDCRVDTADLGTLIADFAPVNHPRSDINGDGIVDTADLGILIGNFGATCE